MKLVEHYREQSAKLTTRLHRNEDSPPSMAPRGYRIGQNLDEIVISRALRARAVRCFGIPAMSRCKSWHNRKVPAEGQIF